MKIKKWISAVLGFILIIGLVTATGYLKTQRKNRNKKSLFENVVKKEQINWVENSFYGLKFRSPDSTFNSEKEQKTTSLSGAKHVVINQMFVKDIFYQAQIMELETDLYNIETGTRGIISTLVQLMSSSDLEYVFEYGQSWLPYGNANGSFTSNKDEYLFSTFITFNEYSANNYLRTLMIVAPKTEENSEIILSSIASIDLDTLKAEWNQLMSAGEKNGEVYPIYDHRDSSKIADREFRERMYKEYQKYKEGN